MPNSSHTRPPLLLLALLLLPVAASSQHGGLESNTRGKLTDQYRTSFIRLMIEFWTPKLNGYKVEIDRMLSAADLVEVNELRTRAALLLEQIERRKKKRREQARRELEASRAEAASPMIGIDSIARPSRRSAEERADFRATEEQREAETAEKNLRLLRHVLAGQTDSIESQPPGRGLAPEHEAAIEDHQQEQDIEAIRRIARWIARNYRLRMEEQVRALLVDMEMFLEVARLHARDFIAVNGERALEDEELIDTILEYLGRIKSTEKLKDGADVKNRIERSRLEALMMVYDGQDLRGIFMVDSNRSATATVSQLPAGIALGQNSPNPAATRTTIPYTLPEPGSSVTLKILDTRGALVATYEQGARQAGEHSLSIDVSALAPGTYLYQLTVTTGGGERVFSKGFQVVR